MLRRCFKRRPLSLCYDMAVGFDLFSLWSLKVPCSWHYYSISIQASQQQNILSIPPKQSVPSAIISDSESMLILTCLEDTLENSGIQYQLISHTDLCYPSYFPVFASHQAKTNSKNKCSCAWDSALHYAQLFSFTHHSPYPSCRLQRLHTVARQ